MGKEQTSARNRLLRMIPKVDEFLTWTAELAEAPSILVKHAVREVLAEAREAILTGEILNEMELSHPTLLINFQNRLEEKMGPNLRPVINATGVVIHTNLGRSILPMTAMDVLGQIGTRYSNLEFDLTSGKRGSRYSLVEDLLCELTGAEAALVVNNNAAAVLLALDTLASGREVIVSRGQLVEIGGSFRIPEVMAKSGAKLIEVGATNRTHLRDYENAISEATALLLKVHTSNYRITGFTAEVSLETLVELGRRHTLPVMEDLGSGCLIDLSRFGFRKEPTVGEVVNAGVDVVTFSGDKLLGGPQAGLILGKKQVIDRIKKNPLNRALRIDKFTLAALETVLRCYFDEEMALRTIPTLAMLTIPLPDIARRARRLLRLVKSKLAAACRATTVQTISRVGGGALPEQDLPSLAVALAPVDWSVNDLEGKLRALARPVIGRIEEDRLLLDMRTVADDEIAPLARCLLDLFLGEAA
ncbi:MAG: L-seryl-tRNA(Sec) selenium transferase [Deltaproteobacteria bacterium RIFOXYD12_FULL_57_12]|nr:MAG: L-seryl-tRNA(Sec) selenium transferase [Deltaproteobacteria bacterium RIFOXYD12_FULL_57_12]